MDTLLSKVCGLDVHASTVVACVLIGDGTRPKKTIRTFRAMYDDLVVLREWLSSEGVEQVVMEGTGVYWRPVYELLEESFDLWLVNARHVKNVPGRKSDVIDAEWLARLLRNGLLRKSFVPPQAIRDIRDLSRYRRMLVQAQTTEKNRVLKLIEMVGLKLALVATDVFGVSGLAMLRAIADGDQDIEKIANLAKGRLRSKIPELRLALRCTIRDHHRMMLRDQLDQFDQTTARIAEYDGHLAALVAPYGETIDLLCSIHGIKRTAATEIFAEIGYDLKSFPRAANFSAWAGTSPGLNESAGKNKSGRRRRGNRYLSSILFECALAATRIKDSYLRDKYYRLKVRRPNLFALFAIANKLAKAVFRVLTTKRPYKDLGSSYLDNRNRDRTAKKLLDRLSALGLSAEEIRLRLQSVEAPVQ